MPLRKPVGVATLLAAVLVPLVVAAGGAQTGKQPGKPTPPKASSKPPPKVPTTPPLSTGDTADKTAAIGAPFRNFTLRDIASDTGATFTLSSLKGKKALVAIYMANRCGTTWTYEEKIGKLLKDYKDKDVQIVAIHSNYRETDAEIMGQIEQRNLAMPVLDDKKTQALADYTETFNTPTFLVIDKEGILRYKGAFDNFGDDTKPYLRPALDAVLAGKTVKTPTTRSFG